MLHCMSALGSTPLHASGLGGPQASRSRTLESPRWHDAKVLQHTAEKIAVIAARGSTRRPKVNRRICRARRSSRAFFRAKAKRSICRASPQSESVFFRAKAKRVKARPRPRKICCTRRGS